MGTFGNPHVGDVGVRFKITMKEDIDTGSFPVINLGNFATRQMVFQRPDKSEFTVTASLFSDGTDGIMYYDSTSTTLNQVGTWKRLGKITDVSANTFKGSWIEFEVEP